MNRPGTARGDKNPESDTAPKDARIASPATLRDGTHRISDALWRRIEPLIPRTPRASGRTYKRRIGGGRKAKDNRAVFDAILFVLRTRCAWRDLPPDHGSVSTIHRRFKQWERDGLFTALWEHGLAEHEELHGIHWMCTPNHVPGTGCTRWQPVHGTPGGRSRRATVAPSAKASLLPARKSTPRADTRALVDGLRAFISRQS